MTRSVQVSVGDERHVVAPSDEFVIGRAADADLVIGDHRVSRHHCCVRSGSSGWRVDDLDSHNGTFVSGRRVTSVDVDAVVEIRLGADDGPVLRVEPLDADVSSTPSAPMRATRDAAVPDPLLGTLSMVTRVHSAHDRTVRIGRASDNDIAIDDLVASRYHAELRPQPDGPELVDLDSHNGTFVNGLPVERTVLHEDDLVGIGHHLFRLIGGELQEYIDTGAVRLEVSGLTVRVDGGRVILDDVAFSLDERSLLAVVGTSGSGKSTLMNSLTGFRPADEGTVWYAGRDLYAAYADLRHRIGYVPQDDVLHRELTVHDALTYAARLRFPSDVSRHELTTRVDEVIDELGLAGRADVPIGRLSGGQRKRASVGLELLTKPSLLFLDEPTSGLDPGYERGLTRLLRDLADGDRTVIVVTHSVQSLDLCDRVLVLAPGGRLAYFGTPREALEYFGADGYAEVFEQLEADTDGGWATRYRGSPLHRRYVEGPQAARRLSQPDEPRVPPLPVKGQGWFRQFFTLSRRYGSIIIRDRRLLLLLTLQAPILGLLLALALPRNELEPSQSPVGFSSASVVLGVVFAAVTWLGLSNSIREVVKEWSVYRRERASGLSVSAYLLSKVAVLAVVTAVQASILVSLALVRQGSGWGPAVIEPPLLEMIVVGILAGWAAMSLGLLVSVTVRSPDRASALLPLLLLVQLLLSGSLPGVTDSPGLREASYLSSTQWAFSAGSATVDLPRLELFNNCLVAAAPSGAVSRKDTELTFLCVRLGLVEQSPETSAQLRTFLLGAGALTPGEIDAAIERIETAADVPDGRRALEDTIERLAPAGTSDAEVDRMLEVLRPDEPLRFREPRADHWVINVAVLAGMTLLTLAAAWAVLARRDQAVTV